MGAILTHHLFAQPAAFDKAAPNAHRALHIDQAAAAPAGSTVTTMTSYLYLGLAIICEVIATSFLARSDGFTKLPPTAIALTGYSISFYLLSLTLRTVPTGVAYAIWSGVGIVLVTAVAYFWQGQKLDAPALAGMAMIVGGVLVINLFSSTAGH